jgi:hypothetical protein
MKLKTLEELQRVAEVRPPLTHDRMSKRQLLERWAEVLELAPQRYLHVTDFGCESCGLWGHGFAARGVVLGAGLNALLDLVCRLDTACFLGFGWRGFGCGIGSVAPRAGAGLNTAV